ncbi:amidohydrolase family protein [Gayadomonas joobiniege]|uniref:amidohydrolase family protein n=1 Tax=Gayadomonas joobiniege TaxID=1234606 RepID=UPI00037BD98B|nr:amidohydrolase family protein [Gayadomonas joobiniege]
MYKNICAVTLHAIFCLLMVGIFGTAYAKTQLFENATLLTLDDKKPVVFQGFLLLKNNKIEKVSAGVYNGDLPIDLRLDMKQKIIMPGFVSGHNHLWQSAFRGIASDQELYGWLDQLHRTYGKYFSIGDYYQFTLHGALDQLLHGITTTYNHSQRMGAEESIYMESLDASVASGQNTIFAYNADFKTSFKEVEIAFSNAVAKVRALNDKNLLGISLNAVGNFVKSQEKMDFEVALARKYGATLQYHYLESYAHQDRDLKAWPSFKQADAVKADVSFAHFIHADDQVLADVASGGAAMIWNPLSNGRLASGLADIPKYLKLGIPVGMGVDGAASADISDPFENMRMGLYALRMQYKNASVMSPIEVIKLHTLATAKILKVDHLVGSLSEGKRADFLVIDMAKPATGALFDVPANLVFSVSSANIEAVYVNGEKLVQSGQPIQHDMHEIQVEVEKRIRRIRAQTK